MATTEGYFIYIKDQLSQMEYISYKKMMGEYLIYYKGKYIAAICDDRLMIRDFKDAENYLKSIKYEKPYEGAKDMLLVETDAGIQFYRELFEAAFEKLPAVRSKSNKKEKV